MSIVFEFFLRYKSGMFVELLSMNGYGQFVWPAFIFSFVSCFYLYLKTQSEFKQLERIYSLKFKKVQNRKIKFTKERESTEKALSIN